MNASEMLMAARCRLLSINEWYGNFCMSVVWKPSAMTGCLSKTMGVCIVDSVPYCIYNPDFVMSLTLPELYTVIQHEIEHLVRMHVTRRETRSPSAWNFVADACINGHQNNPRIGYREVSSQAPKIPHADKLCWIQPSWPSDGSAEQYYELLPKDFINDCELMDDHGVWSQTNTSRDECRQIVADMVKQATDRSQGNVPSHLKSAIDKLSKPKVKWDSILRRFIGNHTGNRRSTYNRLHRRYDRFGMPGISHHATCNINVVLDTSGSISQEDLQQFFAEIELVLSHAKVWLLQWDCIKQGYKEYKRGDWKKLAINGRGGTDMAAAVQWLIDNKRVAKCNVMITDGHTNWAPPQKFPMVTVITTDMAGPGWGKVVRLKEEV